MEALKTIDYILEATDPNTFQRVTPEIVNLCCPPSEYGDQSKYPYIDYLPHIIKPSKQLIAFEKWITSTLTSQSEPESKPKAVEEKQSVISAMRSTFVPMLSINPIQNPKLCAVTTEEICGVQCDWVQYADARIENGVIFLLHGGCYCLLSSQWLHSQAELLSKETGCVCCLPNYSLAPEHPLPKAFDEIHDIYRHLLTVKKVPPSKIVLVGESAGGGLCFNLIQRIAKSHRNANANSKEKKLPMPCCAAPISPWINLANDFDAMHRNSKLDAMWGKEVADLLANLAVGKGNEKKKKESVCSPIYGEFDGLCPLLITVGATECVLDDSLLSAKKAYEAGVDVQLVIHPHGCHNLACLAAIPEGKYMCQRIAQFINKQLNL